MLWPLHEASNTAFLEETVVTEALSASDPIVDVAWTALGAGMAGVLVLGSQVLAEKMQGIIENMSNDDQKVSEKSPLLSKGDLEKPGSSNENGSNPNQTPTVATAGESGLIAPIILVNIPIVLGS